MNRCVRVAVVALLAAPLGVAWAPVASAQFQDDPFLEEPAPDGAGDEGGFGFDEPLDATEAPEEPPLQDARAPAADAAGAAAPGAGEPSAPLAEPSVVARAVLDSERKTPADFVRDLLTLIDLGEAPLGRPLFEELNQRELTADESVGLVTRFGSGALLKLGRAEALGPKAQEFATKCLAVAAERAGDPERLKALVEPLMSDSASRRREAFAGYAAAGERGVAFCLGAMAATNNADHQNRYREALVRLAPLSVPSLRAALRDAEPVVRAQCAWGLGQIGALEAAPHLAALAVTGDVDPTTQQAATWATQRLVGEPPTPELARRLCEQALSDALAGAPPARPDADGTIEVAAWDTAANAPRSARLTVDAARVVAASRVAADLVRVDPVDAEAQAAAVALGAEARVVLKGAKLPTPPVDPLLGDLQANASELALGFALDQGLPHAAIDLLGVLGERRDPSVLHSNGAAPAPVAAALGSGDHAVRFAALRAIMQIDPQQPFPGSSGVPDALVFFATSAGEPAAVVAMPRLADASHVAGLLGGEGFDARATNRGAGALELIAQGPDVELVLVDLEIAAPYARETLFRLRRTAASAGLPIGLLAADGRLEGAKAVAAEFPATEAFPRPQTPEGAKQLVARLRKLAGGADRGAATRVEWAREANAWIAAILERGPTFYRLRDRCRPLEETLVYAGDIEAAVPTLSILGTPGSQVALAGYTADASLPGALREGAARGFAASVRRFGVLLTTDQIVQQYDQYNASEGGDAATQRLLGSLLDAIESRRDAQRSGLPPGAEPGAGAELVPPPAS